MFYMCVCFFFFFFMCADYDYSNTENDGKRKRRSSTMSFEEIPIDKQLVSTATNRSDIIIYS